MSLPCRPDYLPEKRAGGSDESEGTEQLSEGLVTEHDGSTRRLVPHPCQPDTPEPAQASSPAERGDGVATCERSEHAQSNRSLLEELRESSKELRLSDASPGSAASAPAIGDAPKSSLRDAWRDAAELGDQGDTSARLRASSESSHEVGRTASQCSQSTQSRTSGSAMRSRSFRAIVGRVSLQQSTLNTMDPSWPPSSMGNSMAMRHIAAAAEAANLVGASLMAPGATVRAVWDPEHLGGERDDYWACVSLKEAFAATFVIYIEMTLMVVGVAYLENQASPLVLMRGVVIGMVLGWSISYWLVVDYFVFDGGGSLFAVKVSSAWPFVRVEFSEDRELFRGSFFSALVFMVTTSVASLTGLSLICIAMAGVVSNIAATFAYGAWRNGREGFLRVAYVFGGFFICIIIAVHGYGAAWYYDLLRTYFPYIGGVVFSGMFAVMELGCIFAARFLFKSFGYQLPRSKCTISWIIMFVFSSNEAFRLAVLLSDTVMTEKITHQTILSLVSAVFINSIARTQWAIYFVLRLSNRFLFLAPSCAMIVLLECKLTMGYARFASPLTLMTARLIVGSEGHWYFNEAVLWMLLASFLLEFLEDVFVEFLYRKGWMAPIHELARDYYEAFPEGHIRRPYAYRRSSMTSSSVPSTPGSLGSAGCETPAGGKVHVIHLEPFPTRALYMCVANCVIFFGYSQMIPFLSFPYVIGRCDNPRMNLMHVLIWPSEPECGIAHAH